MLGAACELLKEIEDKTATFLERVAAFEKKEVAEPEGSLEPVPVPLYSFQMFSIHIVIKQPSVRFFSEVIRSMPEVVVPLSPPTHE